MRLAPNRGSAADGLYPGSRPPGGRDERHRSCRSARCDDPARVDGFGRDRDLGRADRARRRSGRRQRSEHRRPELAELPRLVRRDPAHVPRRRRGGCAAATPRVEGVRLDRARLVRRAVRRRRAARLLRPRLEPPSGRDRRHRALDDQPRGRLRSARRDRSEPGARRQAAHVRHVRHGHGDRDGSDGSLPHADDLDRPSSSSRSAWSSDCRGSPPGSSGTTATA